MKRRDLFKLAGLAGVLPFVGQKNTPEVKPEPEPESNPPAPQPWPSASSGTAILPFPFYAVGSASWEYVGTTQYLPGRGYVPHAEWAAWHERQARDDDA